MVASFMARWFLEIIRTIIAMATVVTPTVVLIPTISPYTSFIMVENWFQMVSTPPMSSTRIGYRAMIITDKHTHSRPSDSPQAVASRFQFLHHASTFYTSAFELQDIKNTVSKVGKLLKRHLIPAFNI